jgi:hypothetical protein
MFVQNNDGLACSRQLCERDFYQGGYLAYIDHSGHKARNISLNTYINFVTSVVHYIP